VEGFRTRHFADGAGSPAWLLHTRGRHRRDSSSDAFLPMVLTQPLFPLRSFFSSPVLYVHRALQHPGTSFRLLNADDYSPKPFLIFETPRPVEVHAAPRLSVLAVSFTRCCPCVLSLIAHCLLSVLRDPLEQPFEILFPPRAVTHLTLMEADLPPLLHRSRSPGSSPSPRYPLNRSRRLPHEDTPTPAPSTNFYRPARRCYHRGTTSSPRHLVTVRGA